MVGEELVNKIKSIFETKYNKIILRRCSAHQKMMNFHLDTFSYKTLQLVLNDEQEYVGGRLVYATQGKLIIPERRKGTVTVHDNRIVHGVTQLKSGVRYGLFFL
jgi:hypothetical protein